MMKRGQEIRFFRGTNVFTTGVVVGVGDKNATLITAGGERLTMNQKTNQISRDSKKINLIDNLNLRDRFMK
jgi:hypothetical protein